MKALGMLSALQVNTAWEMLITLPRFVYLESEHYEGYLDEVDAVYQVEYRDPEVRERIREALHNNPPDEF